MVKGVYFFYINPVITLRTPRSAAVSGVAAAQASAAISSRDGTSGLCLLPVPSARCLPFRKRVLPSRAWAGNAPSRECARRRPPIAAKPRPSAVPELRPMLPGTPSPCIRPAAARASPAAGPPPRGTRGRESGSSLTGLRERTRQGESSPSVRGSANLVLFWQRGRGLFICWIDTL